MVNSSRDCCREELSAKYYSDLKNQKVYSDKLEKAAEKYENVKNGVHIADFVFLSFYVQQGAYCIGYSACENP